MGEAWGALTVSKPALHLYTLYLISSKGDHNLQVCQLIPFTTTEVIIKERKDNYRTTEPNKREKTGKNTHLWLWLKREQRPCCDVCCEHEQRPSPSSAPSSLFCMLQYFKSLNRGFSSLAITEKLLWTDLCLIYDICLVYLCFCLPKLDKNSKNFHSWVLLNSNNFF